MMRKERYWLLVLLVGALVLPVLAQSTNSTPAMGNTQDARSTGGGKYDQQIQSDINKYLQGHDQTQGVHATVEDGVVTLTGTVNRLIDKLDAEKKAHSIDHVQAVRDEIQVQSNVSDDELRKAFENKFRPKVKCRLIAWRKADEPTARRAAETIRANPDMFDIQRLP